MKDASVQVSKEEANILLQALEMYSSVHDAIVNGLGHRALTLMDKVIAAGLEAGWEEDVGMVSSTTVDIVSDGHGNYVESTPPPTDNDV